MLEESVFKYKLSSHFSRDFDVMLNSSHEKYL